MKTNNRIWLTRHGKDSTANAKAGGFLVSLSHFAVTEYDKKFGREVNEELHAKPLFTGKITSIEAVSGSTIKVVLFIPTGYPEAGKVASIGEVGIYNSDNILFAHGYFDPKLEKASEYGFSLSVYLTCSDLGNVINVIESTQTSVPAVPRVDFMPAAQDSNQNVLAVLDQSENDDGSDHAGLVVKYGPGGRWWSFVDHNRVYLGTVTPDASKKQFELEPTKNGFWLNDQERVIVCCYSGAGSGANRKARFVYPGTFVLDEPLELSSTSRIAIWRDNRSILPTRKPEIPQYAVLGIGQNDFNRSVQQLPTGAFNLVSVEGVLPANTRSIQVPGLSDVTQATKEHFFVYLDGDFVHPSTWILAANGTVSVTPVNAERRYTIDVLNFDGNISASSLCYQTEYEAGEGQLSFQLPVVPNSEAQVAVYLGDKRLSAAKYTVVDTHVDLQDVVVRKDDVVKIAIYVNYLQPNTRSKVVTLPLKVQTGINAYDLGSLPLWRHSLLVFVGPRLITEERYSVNSNGFLTIDKDQLAGVPEGTELFIAGIAYEDGYVAPGATQQTGSDSGPQWVDPAGVDYNPCRVNIKHSTHYSNGVDTLFPVGSLRDKNHAIVFVGNEYLPPDYYDYLPVTSSIMLKSAVPNGRNIDVYSIETPDDPYGMGDRLTFVEAQFLTGNDGGRYILTEGATLDNTFVYVDGKFEHMSNLSISGNVLSLRNEPPSGLNLYVITVLKDTMKGYTTRLVRETVTQTEDKAYPLSHDYTRDGMQVFSGFVFQDTNTYLLETSTQILLKRPVKGLPLDVLWFRNGLPRTRLMLRDEYEAFRLWLTAEMRKYIPWDTDKIQWNNLSRKVHNMLACPLDKLSRIINGDFGQTLDGRGSQSDKELAAALGLQPIKKDVKLDLITTAAYSSIGAGAVFGVPNKFNVFQYLELALRDQLGSDSFSIKKYEIGKKYLIDGINVSGLQFDAMKREEIPQVHNSTSVFVQMSSNPMSTTYPNMPLMIMIWDMLYSNANSRLPAGFQPASEQLKVSGTKVEDTVANLRTFTISVIDQFTGKTYRLKLRRPMRVLPSTYSTDPITILENTDNAPGYVILAARIFANYGYNNVDITQALWSVKNTNYDTEPLDRSWSGGGILRGIVIDNPNYLKTVGYTAGLTFGASVGNFNQATGDAELTISMSGSVGYTYFPADQMMKSMTLPVSYTIYPGIIVKEDGTTEVILSSADLFKSCCWENFTASSVLDCATGEPAVPVTPEEPGAEPYVELSYIDPNYLAANLAASK